MLEDATERTIAHLKRGERIRFGALGILEVRNRRARMGRNAAMGEAVKKASEKVAFRAAKAAKRRFERAFRFVSCDMIGGATSIEGP